MTKEKLREYLLKKVDEIIDEIYAKSLYKYDPFDVIKEEQPVAKKKSTVKSNTTKAKATSKSNTTTKVKKVTTKK